MADALVGARRRHHRGGFPAASPGDFEAVQLIAERVKAQPSPGLPARIAKDIERAAKAIGAAESARIHVSSRRDIHLEYKLKMPRRS